ncbi:hypothetical protein D3C85_1929830 [compost metagenome]
MGIHLIDFGLTQKLIPSNIMMMKREDIHFGILLKMNTVIQKKLLRLVLKGKMIRIIGKLVDH